MKKRGIHRATLAAVGLAALVIVSVGAMIWIWRAGGADLGRWIGHEDLVEECGARISGSTAMSDRLAPSLLKAFLEQSGYTVTVTEPGRDATTRVVGARGAFRCTLTLRASTSTAGLRDLATGQVLIALSQRPFNDYDAAMLRAAGGSDIVERRAEAEHAIALDAVAVVVPASSPVRELEVHQVRNLAAGLTRNWSVVGGADQPVRLLLPRDGTDPENSPNDIATVRDPAFDGIAERATMYDTERALAADLPGDGNAVGILSSAFAHSPQVRAVALSTSRPATMPTAENVRDRLYPLVRRLFLYVRPNDLHQNSFVARFVAFAGSPAARGEIEAAGFFALERVMPVTAAGGSTCLYGTPEAAAVTAATSGAHRTGVVLHFVRQTVRLDDASIASVAAFAPQAKAALLNGGALILIGHTDSQGDPLSNRTLGLRRATSVRTAFEREGVFGAFVESAGERCLSHENASDSGRRSNQRVEVWLRPAPAAQSPASPTGVSPSG